jgi:hypothetical protein
MKKKKGKGFPPNLEVEPKCGLGKCWHCGMVWDLWTDEPGDCLTCGQEDGLEAYVEEKEEEETLDLVDLLDKDTK